LQILGAAVFFMAGLAKLSGDDHMVQVFDAIGIGQWFRYVTGAIEVSSSIMLLIPALSGVGALLLVATMVALPSRTFSLSAEARRCRSDS
jgi:uncharacterized membrane protein YphA (DoxX/SURF4 family)